MTKSELIEIITAKQKHLPAKDVELALKQMLEIMSDSLAQGDRIEIRGFGSFSLHFRPPRQGRNPKTGEQVTISELIGFATDYLKVDYIFWCTQEPYYSDKVIPLLQARR